MYKLITATGLIEFNQLLESEARDGWMPIANHTTSFVPAGAISKFVYSVMMYNPLIKLSIIQLEKKRIAWSLATFKDATAISSILKLKEEVKEIEMDVIAGERKPEEYADALMCLFDSAGRQPEPITPEEIIEAFRHKLELNISSDWIKQPDNTYKRIKKENHENV